MKRIAILGSTGSIGSSALSVIAQHPDHYRVSALSANQNIELLARQIRRFRPSCVAVQDHAQAAKLQKSHRHLRVLAGSAGIAECAALAQNDIVLLAIAGSAALPPLLAAIGARKTIALANKESLVMAGGIVMERARKKGAVIIPVDSEHSAIFQCLQGQDKKALAKIYLTGSGGPLLQVPRRRFSNLSPEAVLKHPKWNMGKKITVDSATMMNKGLEVIEAHWLFGLPPKRIEVLVHPQAIIHSMTEFTDGSILAQLAVPDMRIPIAYAFSFPRRLEQDISRPRFADIGSLTFLKPDVRKFPCLGLAYYAAKKGGMLPAVLNAANEEAVAAFLKKQIRFNRIPQLIEKVMMRHKNRPNPSLADIFVADAEAREEARRLIC